jgi:hypothetical protein
LKAISKVIPALTTAMLVGCGGGGGDTATTNATTPVAASISATNASDAIAYAYSGVENLDGQSNSSALLVADASIDTQSTGLIAASLAQLYSGLQAQPLDGVATGVTTSRTVACAGGGSISATVTEAVAGTRSNGDSMALTANNCVSDGDVLNGRVDFGFSDLSGTIGSSTAWSAKLAMNFTNFSVQSGGNTLRADGDMTLAYTQTGYQVATAVVSGSSLQMNLTKSDGTLISCTLTAYGMTGSINVGTYTSSANFIVTGSSPRLGTVNFTVRTNTAFRRTGAANPSTGSVTVTATDKSSATLTVLDSTYVKIDLDKNGDGVTDETSNTTWAELRSRI